MSFEDLNLIKQIETAIKAEGYVTPTPIQQQAIPAILDGKNVLGSAQTGTGKTAAFAIPILQLLFAAKNSDSSEKNFSEKQNYKSKKNKFSFTAARLPKALILTPTRELAVQIGESFNAYGKFTGLKNTVIYGGVPQNRQTEKLRSGVDILVATPGRLLDLMNQGFVKLEKIEIFVLDEADRMLDMGFIIDIKKIIEKLPAQKQSLFFSATMPPSVVKLAGSILSNPVKIDAAPQGEITLEAIKQGVYFVAKPDKKALLLHILTKEAVSSALVFTRTKHGADQVAKILNNARINSDVIHGNKSQSARQRALNNFKDKKIRVLVATDIASRGIDIDQLSHVINFEIPDFSENYVHRIGRTGRAGLTGTALSFCDRDERAYLRDINKLIKIPIPVINDHPFADRKEEVTFTGAAPFKPRNKKSFAPKKADHFRHNFKKKSRTGSKKNI